MLERMQSKCSIPPPLVGVQTCIAALEISIAVTQKIGNQTTLRSNNITLGYIPKGCTLIPQGYLLNCIHSTTIHDSQNLKTT